MDDRALSQASLNLRNAAPREWEAFVLEIGEIERKVTAFDVLEIKQENLPAIQGWARAARWFLRCFKQCADKVERPTAVDHHPV